MFGDIRQAETTDASCSIVENCVEVRRHNAKPHVGCSNYSTFNELTISSTLFYIAFIPGLLSVVLIFLLKEKKNSVSTMGKGTFFSFFRYWKIANPEFRKIVPGLLLFALFNSSDIFLLLITKETIGSNTITLLGSTFNADTITIAAYIFYNLVYALASYPMGMLADKIGFKRVVIFGLILFTIVYGGFAFNPSVLLIFILFAIYGFYAAATEGVIKAWITNLSHNQDTATAIGFYTSCESMSTLFASIIAGAIWTSLGSSYTFIITAVISLVVVLYFSLIIKAK